MGNKDGYGGAWFFSLIGKQNLNSIDELKAAMIGKAKFSEPKYSGFYQALADLKKKGYLNSDVASISFTQGLQLFGQKKVAMSWITDGYAAAAAKTLGGTKGMGVGPIPIWGKGKLARELRHHPVVVGVHHEVVEAPEGGGAVPHVPALASRRSRAWYKATGVFPADKRFPASLVTDPIAKQRLKLDLSPVSVWPENFVPPQVDGNADLPAGELITSGSGSPADAVKLWEREIAKWKSQHPDEFRTYSKWARQEAEPGGSHRAPAAVTGGGCSGPISTFCPPSAAMAFAFGYPLVQVVRDSFYAGNFASPIWVGLDNYSGVIEDPAFRQSLVNNLKLLLAVPVMLGLGLAIALVLNDRIRGGRHYQAIIFLPVRAAGGRDRHRVLVPAPAERRAQHGAARSAPGRRWRRTGSGARISRSSRSAGS